MARMRVELCSWQRSPLEASTRVLVCRIKSSYRSRSSAIARRTNRLPVDWGFGTLGVGAVPALAVGRRAVAVGTACIVAARRTVARRTAARRTAASHTVVAVAWRIAEHPAEGIVLREPGEPTVAVNCLRTAVAEP